MSDLISRQAAIEAVNIDNLHRGIVDALQNIILELPSADVVPVVRCKDCKHRQELGWCPMYHLNYARYEWQLDDDCDDYTKDDGFCDRGERKDDE